MHSTKGFLQPGPNGGRMTASQIEGVAGAVVNACAVIGEKMKQREILIALSRFVAEILRAYPADRSCHTCDYYVGEGTGAHYCRSWQSEIPKTHVEGGCSRHQTDGAPF